MTVFLTKSTTSSRSVHCRSFWKPKIKQSASVTAHRHWLRRAVCQPLSPSAHTACISHQHLLSTDFLTPPHPLKALDDQQRWRLPRQLWRKHREAPQGDSLWRKRVLSGRIGERIHGLFYPTSCFRLRLSQHEFSKVGLTVNVTAGELLRGPCSAGGCDSRHALPHHSIHLPVR